jgi:uncharacterized protein YifE (UPF0438 family)
MLPKLNGAKIGLYKPARGMNFMSNMKTAKMSRKAFLAFCAETRTAEEGKKTINTAHLTLAKQLKRFSKTSFSDADIQALYKNAISV